MRLSKLILTFLSLALIFNPLQAQNDAHQLIQEVVEANGGIQTLKQLKDVSYEYTFRSMEKGIIDNFIERYIFDGEISFAQYTDRQYFVLPEVTGIHTQKGNFLDRMYSIPSYEKLTSKKIIVQVSLRVPRQATRFLRNFARLI